MITEDYCSYEVAKLLKEKGFEGICDYAYSNKGNYFEIDRSNFDEVYCLRPTLQMAMKWLREVHYIHANPIKQGNYNDCSDYYTWIVARMGYIHRNPTVAEKLSYEEAVEAALKYSLENLI